MKAALAGWRACLKDMGYVVVDLTEATAQARRRYSDESYEKAWDFGRAIAVADARCNRDYHVREVGDRWHKHHTDRLLRDVAAGYYGDEWDHTSTNIASQFRYMDNNSMSWENHWTGSACGIAFFTNSGGTGTFRFLKKGYADWKETDIDNDIEGHVGKSSCSGCTLFSGQFYTA